MTACLANSVSMWSKNGMPVLMDDFPRPSMFSLRLMRVSLVTRLMAACRDFMPGIKQKRGVKQSGKEIESFNEGMAGWYDRWNAREPLSIGLSAAVLSRETAN